MVDFNSSIYNSKAYQSQSITDPALNREKNNKVSVDDKAGTETGAPFYGKKDQGVVYDKSTILQSMVEDLTPVSSAYGKTVGKPELSEKAQKYYESLKAKFGDMDFVLVSKDMKNAAQQNAASYANPDKMVVLISEEEVEKMASDPNFRSKYEGIIQMAKEGISALKDSFGNNDDVKGYGVQIDDKGNASYFAVVKRANDLQAERIKEGREERRAEAKKEAKEEQQEKLKDITNARNERIREAYGEQEDFGYDIIRASSIDELIENVSAYFGKGDANAGAPLGQSIDFMA